MLALLMALLSLVIRAPAAAQTSLPKLSDLKVGQWNTISPAGETICARGTPYHFFVRPTEKPSDNLAIFFQGGGACWSAQNCAPNFRFPPDAKNPIFVEAVSETDSDTFKAGIFDYASAENPFADFNAVVVSYCTADVHTGDTVANFKDQDNKDYTINFKGAVNARAVLEWTYANFDKPALVFLSGSSAGAYGAIYHAPSVMSRYQDAKVVQLGDAGIGVVTPAFDGFVTWGAVKNLPDFIPGFKAIEPKQITHNLLYNEAAKAFPNNTFAEYTTWTDTVQIGFSFLMGGGAKPEEAGANWVVGMRSNLTGLQGSVPNFRGYTAWGNTHTILRSPDFYTYQVNGVRVRDWVADLVAGKPVRNVLCSDCASPELYQKP
jgi:hypothetical protein